MRRPACHHYILIPASQVSETGPSIWQGCPRVCWKTKTTEPVVRTSASDFLISEGLRNAFQNKELCDLTAPADRRRATISRNVADGLDIAQHAPWDRIASPTSGAAQWITANSPLSPASPWRF